MADFDFGNARLRAQMAGMMSGQALSMLAQSSSPQVLVAGLAKTPYRRSVERAQTQASGTALLEAILSEEVYGSVQELLRYYSGSALEQIRILLAYEDAQNLKIILRGIQKGAHASDISAALLQWGYTPPAILKNVAESESMDEALARLAILGNSAAAALSALTPEQLTRAAEVDYALEKWFFNDVLVKNAKDASPALLYYFRMRADIFDILTICARFLLPNFSDAEVTSGYLLAQGSIPLKVLRQSAGSPTLEQALLSLRRTPYFAALRPLLDRGATITLSAIDKRLQGYQWNWVRRQPHRDPLGIGVPIGFIHKKKRELECLRYIASSIKLGLRPDCILENMEIPE